MHVVEVNQTDSGVCVLDGFGKAGARSVTPSTRPPAVSTPCVPILVPA